MGYSARGTMADGACHIMKAIMMIGWVIVLTADLLSMEVVLNNPMLMSVIRVVLIGILALTAILGRNEMSAGGNKAANSCLYWAFCYHAYAYSVDITNNAAWGQISVCGLVEMGLVLLVYILCSGDALWTVLLNMISGVGIAFSGHGMISAGWNGWIIAVLLIAEAVVLWLLVEFIDKWIVESLSYDTWGKDDRKGGYIWAGVCLTVVVAVLCGVFVPISRNVTVKHSDTAYYNGQEKSAALYHVNFGSTEEWKLPEYIMQFVDDEECAEYLVVRQAKPILDFGIGKICYAQSYQMTGHNELHHVSDMKLVWLSWQDATTISIDGMSYTLK